MNAAFEVHALIQKMSASERRYFRLSAENAIGRESRRYTLLFDLLRTMPQFDNDAWTSALSKTEEGTKHISQDLAYLRAALLRALRGFHAGSKIGPLLRDMLSEAEILMDKGLHESAERVLIKAKKKAERHGKSIILLEIHDLESILLKSIRRRKIEDSLQALRASRIALLRTLNAEQDIADLYNQAFSLQASGFSAQSPESIQRVNEILQHPLIADSKALGSFQGEHLRLQTRIFCHAMLGDQPQIFACTSQALLLWEQHPVQVEAQPEKFQKILANALAASFDVDVLDAVPDKLRTLRHYAQQAPDSQVWRILHYYEMMYFMAQGQFGAARKLIPGIKDWAERNPSHAPITWLIPMWYNFMVTEFLSGEWREALRWCRRILQEEHAKIRRDLSQAAKILQLVLFFELGEDELLHYLARNTRAQVSEDFGANGFEHVVIRFLSKMANSPQAGRTAHHFAQLHAAMDKIASRPAIPEAKGFQEIRHWAKAREAGQPIDRLPYYSRPH